MPRLLALLFAAALMIVLVVVVGALQFERGYPNREVATPTPKPATDAWTMLAQRPLKISALAPGGPCPTSGGKIVAPDFGLALGDGPVYPVGFSANGIYYYGSAVQDGNWYLLKVLWIADPSYHGPALVRGKQMDGPDNLGFKEAADLTTDLRLDAGDSSNRLGTGWGNWPTYTRLRIPGCYAYQVDGTNFSRVVVFEASNTLPPPPSR